MVRLVEIEDESAYDDDSQYTTESEAGESAGSVGEKDLESDFEDYDEEGDYDDDLLDESLLERLVALRDIIPARHQQAIARAASTVGFWGEMGARLAGKLAWVFTTSALLVVFPLALEGDRDKMMQQWEAEQMQQPGGALPGQPPMMPPPGAAGFGGMAAPAPGLA
ncbi:mitochondrial import receptor subunit Tom22 [Coemansia nantahalensis]|nr:mitochondrial import receptor subunit Tom22 [Coemansia nantahalensis]